MAKQTRKELVEELALLKREELDLRAIDLKLEVTGTWKDSTVRSKIVQKLFPKDKSLNQSKKIKVKILLPVAGRFLLSYAVDEIVLMKSKQALELIDLKYAEAVK